MAAPNIVNVTTIIGKTSVAEIGSTNSAIVTNSSSSGKVLKINALYVSNIDGINSATIDVSIERNSVVYYIARTVNVPKNATLDVISKSIYLEEGDALNLKASDTGDLHGVCSYEEIS